MARQTSIVLTVRSLAVILVLAMVTIPSSGQVPPPSFSKSFSPSTMGPGSVSTLTFTINNAASGVGATSLAFTDTLPAGVTIATPSGASTTCSLATLTAPDGGSTITFSGGTVGPGSSCTATLNVTASTAGTHTNTSGDLTSSAGNSGTASANLTVDSGRPGFIKSFSPSTIGFGQNSTLTFTIDNSANGSLEYNPTFTDNLPANVVVASPPNASTSCTNLGVTAVGGSGTITAAPTGTATIASGATCTVSVDVVGVAVGAGVNLTELTYLDSGTFSNTTAGKAIAGIDVTSSELILTKSFLDDPVAPGDTVDLELTILNRSRSDTATNLTFTDDLDATLSGLVAIAPLPTDPCGAGSTVTGTSLLTLSGGTLTAGSSCTFTVTLQIPGGAATGSYANTTSSLTGDLGGVGATGTSATDQLFVQPIPVLTKTFTTDPVGSGQTATMEFTITNSDTTSSATGITFQDNIGAFIDGSTFASLPASGFCGAGSTASQTLVFDQWILVVSNANLAPGASCTFSVGVSLPSGIPSGDYTNTTSSIDATIGGATYTGKPASDVLSVVGAPSLRKEFLSAMNEGGTTTLQFMLEHDAFAPGDATGISFTDNLNAVIAGLAATGLPMNDVCGVGSQISGTTTLTLTGGTLSPGGTCTFSVTVQDPPGTNSGTFTNTTSPVTATVNGETALAPAANAELLVSSIVFTKEFTDDPLDPGASGTLRFTIDNQGADDATAISFTDSLTSALSGLAATSLPATPCGAGSTITGTTNLVFSGGSVTAGTSCMFDVTVTVPGGATPGISVVNTTSNLIATINGVGVALPPATDTLQIADPSANLLVSKSFTGTPVSPGGTFDVVFTLENTSATTTIDTIAFTDDLDAALSGMTTSSTATAFCGPASSLTGTSVISVAGVQIAPGTTCTFSATLNVPLGAAPGTYTNTTSSVTGNAGGVGVTAPAASADFDVVEAVQIAKSFTNDPVRPGATVDLQFTVSNLSPAFAATGITFTDDLDATLTGLAATGLPMSDVCGTGSTLSGTSVLTFSGGSLAASATCTFTVTLQVPTPIASGTYTNITSPVDATVNGSGVRGIPATDGLVIEPQPIITKTFTVDPAQAGSTSVIQFTITNTSNAASATGVTFTDDLGASIAGMQAVGLPANDVCGVGSQLTGTGILALSGGTIAASSSCTFSVTVSIPSATTPGDYVNTTSQVAATVSGTGYAGAAASDTLTVITGPTIAKSFIDDPVNPGDSATLRFTLSLDAASQGDATSISFTDDLGAVLTGLTAVGLPANDVCGTGSQISGTSTLTLTGGTLTPGGTCTFDVQLQIPAAATPANYTNTTSALSATVLATAVTGAPATDTLVVNGLGLTKLFTDDPVTENSNVTLQFTLTNLNPSTTVDAITFSDDLNAALAGLTATGLPMADVCGVGSQLSGTSVITLTGGTLAPSGSCTFQVSVQVPAAAPIGNYTNTTSGVSATIGGAPVTAPAASDVLTVSAGLALTKTFLNDPVAQGDQVTLEITVSNLSTVATIDSIAFTDDLDAAMAGLVAIGLPMADVCGTGSQISGTSVLSLTGGTLAQGTSCTFSVTLQVPGAPAGDYTNTTSAVTGQIAGTPTSSPAASDVLTVTDALAITKSFTDDPAAPNGTVTLSFTITNLGTSSTVDSIGFTDDLNAALAGLAATGLPMADVCGVGSQLSGTSVVMLTGGTLGPSGSCTFQVTLQVPASAAEGTYTNTTSAVSGMIAGNPVTAPAATDILSISQGLVLTKTFLNDPVAQGDQVTLELTVSNPSAVSTIDSIAFTDDLDAALTGLVAIGLPMADVCGVGSQLFGTSVLSLTGGTLAPGTSCTISVPLQVPGVVAGDYTNTTSTVTSQIGGTPKTAPAASDVLTITDALSITKSFTDDPAAPNGTVTLEFTITNLSTASAVDSIGFTDDLNAALTGLAATGLPMADVCGTGSQVSGTTALSLTGGTLAPSAICTFQVTLQVPASAAEGTYTNTTSAVSGMIGGNAVTAPAATDMLSISEGLALTKTFLNDPVAQGDQVTLELTVSNLSAVSTIDSIAFTDDLDAALTGLVAIGLPMADVCGVGSQLTGTSVLSLTGGTLAPGTSCTISVPLQVPGVVAGDYTNTTSIVTGQIGGTPKTAPAASDVLTVTDALAFTKSFTDDPAAPNGTVALEFTITNLSTASAVDSIGFTDDLNAALAGLTATGLPMADVCGVGSQLTGTSVLTLSGGTLAPGTSCTFSATLQLPATVTFGATYTNTTSAVSGLINGGPATGPTASDALAVDVIRFGKVFQGVAAPGGTAILQFTIENLDPANPVTGIGFTDDLDAMLPGTVAFTTPLADVCGAGSMLSGTSVLTFTGGSLGPGGSCSIFVSVSVPPTATPGNYVNATSILTSGVARGAGPATTTLIVGAAAPNIPTLDEWGMLLLILLLAGIAVVRLSSRI